MTACGEPAATERPTVPPQLVAHDELPFGDAASARITRASNAARDLLEPRWGRLDSRVYTLPVGRRDELLAGLPMRLPPGWTAVPDIAFPKDRGMLLAYAGGNALHALLLVNAPAAGDSIPVVLFDTPAPR